MKPKELKPKEAKPVEYNDYFLKGLVEIRKNNQPVDFNDLTYNFKGPEYAPINLVEPSFQEVNRLFVLAFENDTQRASAKG